MNALGKLLVTGLGTGYLRPAPGTWGSLGCCAAIAGLLAALGPGWALQVSIAAVALVSSIVCIALGPFTETTFGKKDPGSCSIDEWAGQAVALLALPMGTTWPDHGLAIGVAFVGFRLFDILKPPPCRRLERLPAGWGVVADDLLAGVYANVIAQLVLRLGVGL